MLKRLKEYLYIKELDPEIERSIDRDTMRFCRLLSTIVMFFEVVMLILYGFLGNQDDDWYVLRICCYIGYFAASVVWFFLSKYARDNVTNHKVIMAIALGYSSISVIWSILISATDYMIGEQVLVFITIVICIAGFAFFKPFVSALFFTLSFGAFYAVLLYIDGAANAVITNYFILWLMITLSCIARYHTKLSDTMARVGYEKLNQTLKKMSLYDELTKVKNRHCLSLDLQGFMGKELFLMLIDIDGFKDMNDTYGHDIGDCVLTQFAQVMQSYFTPQHVYRYGGDEFLIAIADCPQEVLLKKIKRCQKDMSRLRVDHMHTGIAFSGGYLVGRMNNKQEFEAMLKRVDNALYLAKRNGRDQVIRADYKMA